MFNKLVVYVCLYFMSVNLIALENENTVIILKEDAQNTENEALVSYVSKEGNFTVGFPEKWEVVEGVMGRDLIAMAPSEDPEDLFLENANIIYAKLDAPIKQEEYYRYNLQSLQQLLIDYDLEESSDVKLQGREAKRIIFTHTMGVVNAKVLQYLLLIGDQAYVLTFTADPLDFDEFRPRFERIANTFQVKDGSTQ